MDIKIGSFFSLKANIVSQKTIRRLRFKIIPFIIRELKIGDLFNLTSGITYVKILDDSIPEIVPKIKIEIKKVSLSELLSSGLSNLDEFFPYMEGQSADIHKKSMDYFIAIRGKELVYFTAVGVRKRDRLMILGTKTLERFRGNNINPAILVYIMRYLRDVKKIDKVYIGTSGTNISMQKSILKAGFKIDIIFYDISLFNGWIRPMQFLRKLRDM